MAWQIKHWTEFADLAPEWRRIVTSSYSDHPLLDAKLVATALECFADNNVRMLVECAAGTVQSIAILAKKRWGVWETFAPSQMPITLFVTGEPRSTTSVASTLIRALPGHVLLLGLTHFDEKYMGGEHRSKLLEKIEYGKTMNVTVTGEFDDYWASRSKNLRKSIRRYERKLKSRFDYRMEVQARDSVLFDAVEIYGDIESGGWKGKLGSAVHKDNQQGEFYCSCLKEFADNDGARAFHLIADDRPIASRLAIIQNGIMVILKTTYDESYSEFAPGRLLLKYVLRYAFEDNSVNNVEFYTKATEDQLRWATSSRFTYHYNFYSSTIVSWAAQRTRRR